MKKFIISCESTVDLPYSYLKERNASIIFYSYIINEEVKIDDMGRDKNALPNFYKQIDQGAMPTTSQINETQYEEYFEELIKENNVLHISFTSGLTPSIKNAQNAAKILNEKYENKITVIDSKCASSGYGMLVDYALDLKDEGKDLDYIINWIENNKENIHHEFFATDLTHFKRGGRVKASTAFVAGILGICPLMTLNLDGKIVLYGKAHGKKKAMKNTADVFEKTANDGIEYDDKCYICHSGCEDIAISFKEYIEERFTNLKGKIQIHNIGTIIGCHTGVGTCAIFYMGSKRTN